MKADTNGCLPIPGPAAVPLLGNILDVQPGAASDSLFDLAKVYGEIYQLQLPGERMVVVNTRDLLDELCDETRFRKMVNGSLAELRSGVNNGLITAETSDPDWKVAHRIAMPLFSPLKIRDMFDQMKDIISQLCLKWARLGPSYVIDVNRDLTRMALDVVGLCSMGYRFNSFYSEGDVHPFVKALNSWLTEADARSWRLPISNHLRVFSSMRFQEDIHTLRSITQDLVEKRRQDSALEGNDLLHAMMKGRDPETGAKLSDEALIDNILTLLAAGHETTSGTVSFALWFLIQNPQALIKAQQELDRVLGDEPLRAGHLSELPYIDAILRETLRLKPTAPALGLTPYEDEIVGGKYQLRKGDSLVALLFSIHRDPKVYGDDAGEWKPERMLEENFRKLPPNSWKPFGNGMRACLGRPFAWQESQIALAMLLHTFNFELADPSYNLHYKDAVTINPVDFKIRVRLREKARYGKLLEGRPSFEAAIRPPSTISGTPSNIDENSKPFYIFYGSEGGTCETLAHRFASRVMARGFRAEVEQLNAAKERVPKGHPVVIIVSSYNGTPPQNAFHFVTWLQSLSEAEMGGVTYSVFGCGHRDWVETFQRVPKLVDELMEKRGGQRMTLLGSADACTTDVFSEFEDWEEQSLWPAIAGATPSTTVETRVGPKLSIQVTFPRLKALRDKSGTAIVASTKLLTGATVPEKRHMELRLPEGSTYRVGDYLAVLPVNPQKSVQRALARFGLSWDSVLQISSTGPTDIPTQQPISAGDVFGQYVELGQPASARNIRRLAQLASDDVSKRNLSSLAEMENPARHPSILDLLEEHPSVDLPVSDFLSMLPPLRARTYSISSSPLADRAVATITYSVVSAPHHSDPTRRHLGVASTYLSHLLPGTLLPISIRSPKTPFTLPPSPEDTPLVMIAAGAGIAPFRGFVQERAVLMREGRRLAPALLFFGCRRDNGDRRGDGGAREDGGAGEKEEAGDGDDLYRDEFDAWERAGAVTVHRAYSRPLAAAATGKYVQDVLHERRDDVAELWARGARVYVCGAPRMAGAVGEVIRGIVGADDGSLDGRYLSEIFS